MQNFLCLQLKERLVGSFTVSLMGYKSQFIGVVINFTRSFMKTELVGMQRVFNFNDSFQHILQGQLWTEHTVLLAQ